MTDQQEKQQALTTLEQTQGKLAQTESDLLYKSPFFDLINNELFVRRSNFHMN